jgi:hypothetical protein
MLVAQTLELDDHPAESRNPFVDGNVLMLQAHELEVVAVEVKPPGRQRVPELEHPDALGGSIENLELRTHSFEMRGQLVESRQVRVGGSPPQQLVDLGEGVADRRLPNLVAASAERSRVVAHEMTGEAGIEAGYGAAQV